MANKFKKLAKHYGKDKVPVYEDRGKTANVRVSKRLPPTTNLKFVGFR